MLRLFRPKPIPYNTSKEYLERQQKIDYMLVLSGLLEMSKTVPIPELQRDAARQIAKLIEDLK